MSEKSDAGSSKVPFIPLSPPKCEVDDTPLRGKSLNKNKESLKVKLMLRRPRHDLVSRGVIPDSPNNMDRSLVAQQKQLQRARIADTISSHLCQRPGPLELIKANILHTSEDLEKAVKEGQLIFKSTSEGEPRKHPSLYLLQDDESSSEALSPEHSDRGSRESSIPPIPVTVSPNSTSITPITVSSLILPSFSPILSSSSSPLTSNSSSLSPLSSLASPQVISSPPGGSLTQTLLVTPTLPPALTTPPLQNSAPGKDQSKGRKKAKGKSQPKTRTIKFHEYKGPPSAAKKDTSTPVETSYDILLQQQQLFLQCQLQQKYPQIIFPAVKSSEANTISMTSHTPIAPAPSTVPPAPPPPPIKTSLIKLPSKLEELKVSDLKAELKKRNLPVSGSKPNLIERLKLHTTPKSSLSSISQESEDNFTPRSSIDLSDEPSVNELLEASMEVGEENIASPAYSQISTRPSSAGPMDIDGPLTPLDFESLTPLALQDSLNTPPPPPPPPPLPKQFKASPSSEENVVQLEQKVIDLQRQLQEKELQLQVQRQQSMSKATDLYRRCPQLPNDKAMQQQLELECRKQMIQQRQLKSRMEQLQHNLKQEQKALNKNINGRDSSPVVLVSTPYVRCVTPVTHISTPTIQMSAPSTQVSTPVPFARCGTPNHVSHVSTPVTRVSTPVDADILLRKDDSVNGIELDWMLNDSALQETFNNAQKESIQRRQDSLEDLLIFHDSSTVQEHPYRQQYALVTEQPSESGLHIQQPTTQHAYKIEFAKRPAEQIASSQHRQVRMTCSLPNYADSHYVQSGSNVPNSNCATSTRPSVFSPADHRQQMETQSSSYSSPSKPEQVDSAFHSSYKNDVPVDDVLQIIFNSDLPVSSTEGLTINPVLSSMSMPPPSQPPPRHQPIQSSSPNNQNINSPSIFADLVLESQDINMDLPVLRDIELSHHLDDKKMDDSRKLDVVEDRRNLQDGDWDVTSYLESLTTPNIQFQTNSVADRSSSSSSSSGYGSFNQSDPLLGSSSDHLDFMNDFDLKAPINNIHDVSWDKLDFTT